MKYIMAYLPYGCNLFEAPFDHEVQNSFSMVPRAGFSGPWSLPRQNSVVEAEPKTFRFDAHGFKAIVDCHLFEPQQISVKTIDHMIVVECSHDSREDDHGVVERHFVRKFNLPFEYDMSLVRSSLSKDGILHLEAPKPQVVPGEERSVEVEQTEKPSFLMSLLSNRAHSLMKRSHSIPSDEEDNE